jgi:hypothetical protein
MGAYCKAYETARLAEFRGWPRGEGGAPKGHLFLHEDFTVTSGISPEEGVVFDAVTAEWVEFCRGTLEFAPPAEEE